MEYPIDKIRSNLLERLILEGFYATAKIFDRQAQMTVLTEKPQSAETLQIPKDANRVSKRI